MTKITEMSDEEKRKLIEFKDTDDAGMRAMKAELQLVMDMTKEERQVFYQEQRVAEEENQLQWMVDSNKNDDEFIKYATARARSYARDIQLHGEEPSWLEAAEQWIEIAQLTKANKYTIADIRKQRERIWQQKRKLNQMTKPATEPKQSSSHSRT